MKMVDDGKLKTTPAVELSYLTPEEQEDFLSYMESEGCTPSLSQAQKLKEASKESVLTLEKIQHIMAAKPPSVKPRDPQLMLKLPVPALVGGKPTNIQLKPSEIQKQMVTELGERADKIRNKMVKPYEDNMLKIVRC